MIGGMRPFSSRILGHAGTTTFSKPQVYVSRNPHPSVKKLARKMEARAAEVVKMGQKPDYNSWSQEKLIDRVTQLEKDLKISNQRSVRLFNALKETLVYMKRTA